MQKHELLKQIKQEMGAEAPSLTTIDRTVEATFAAIAKAMRNRDSVNIAGFGSFKADLRKERTITSPITKEEMTVPAKFVPKFTPSSILKAEVKG